MQIRAEEITSIIKSKIQDFEVQLDVAETGVVLSVGDGIARIHGLEKCMAGELLEFPGGVMGMALNLEEDNVGAALLGESAEIKEGSIVKRTGSIVSVNINLSAVFNQNRKNSARCIFTGNRQISTK